VGKTVQRVPSFLFILFLGLEAYDFIGEIGLKYEKYAVLSTGSDGDGDDPTPPQRELRRQEDREQ
jgi:hypothetical protein